jgi:hypothetical protein
MVKCMDMLTANALMEGYLAALQESGSALYEGYTKSGMALGKYLKSLDDGAKIQNPAGGVAGVDQYMYVMMARKPQAIATILDACANITGHLPTEEGYNQIEKGLAQYLGNKNNYQDSYAHYIGQLASEVKDKSGFAKAAAEFSHGNAYSGFKILKSIQGFDIGRFLDFIRNSAGIERNDRGNMSMNPDTKKSRVMNKWLFHGTTIESAKQIALHGFDRGNKIGDLAYNDSEGTAGMRHDYTGDYLFAFDAEDVTDSRDEQSAGKIYRAGKYGAAKIMFKASGYKIYHKGDEENQVIFDYHEPTGCFLILPKRNAGEINMPAKKTTRDEWLDSYQVVGCGKDGKPKVLFSTEDLKPCIRWVLKNGDAYSRLMFKWK